MNFDEFLAKSPTVTGKKGPHDQIVMSSRARLARNLVNSPFPGWAKKNERLKIFEKIRETIDKIPVMSNSFSESMDAITAVDKQVLVERHLISREHAANGIGSGLVVSPDALVSIMINEEDHMRMQALRPGLQVQEAFNEINNIDDLLEEHIEYAFNDTLGYLTACPTNIGSAIRVSAMLHLPGLVLAEQINQIIQAINKLGLAVRGLYGEGTEALGNIFQVSNQMTLGENELEIVERLNKVAAQLIEQEENARAIVLEKSPKLVYNNIGRAYGILANAHIISSKEALNLLSLVRLGIDIGLFPGIGRELVDDLFIRTQPAHLQKNHAGKLSAEQRDTLRADMIRERLLKVNRPLPEISGNKK
ncbi:MAG: protein arginine kinase [Verrucomicrobia bacterium]|nr:protein arginine kinase [Verrucomicrobiota bacterium]MCF7709140.1 protein arginine kinase [Verrucomicrobiota bacterium]